MEKSNHIIICAWQYPAYSETFISDHVNRLLERGWSVDVFTHKQGAPELLTRHPHLRVNLWPGLTGRLKAARQLLRILRTVPADLWPHWVARAMREITLRPDRMGLLMFLRRTALLLSRLRPESVIHAHFAQQGELVARLMHGKMPCRKFVCTLHGFDINRPFVRKTKPYRWLWRAADSIIVGSEYMRERALALGAQGQQTQVLPVGVDLARWPYVRREPHREGAVRVLSVGRHVPYKAGDILIEAMARAIQRGAELKLVIVGEGPSTEAWKQLVEQLDLSQQIEFRGRLDHSAVHQEMQLADIFVYPSRTIGEDSEGQGLAVQEAQACGVPVLATRHGGIPEGVIDGKTAILVQENDVDSLAQGLMQLNSDANRRIAMGLAGRALVQERFNQHTLMDRLIGLYHQAEDGSNLDARQQQ